MLINNEENNCTYIFGKIEVNYILQQGGRPFQIDIVKKMKQGNEEEEKKEILDRTAVTSTQHRSSFPPTFNTTVTIFGFLDRSEVGCWNSSNRHFAQNQFCEIMQKNA